MRLNSYGEVECDFEDAHTYRLKGISCGFERSFENTAPLFRTISILIAGSGGIFAKRCAVLT